MLAMQSRNRQYRPIYRGMPRGTKNLIIMMSPIHQLQRETTRMKDILDWIYKRRVDSQMSLQTT